MANLGVLSKNRGDEADGEAGARSKPDAGFITDFDAARAASGRRN
jgi:hypothetical protein